SHGRDDLQDVRRASQPLSAPFTRGPTSLPVSELKRREKAREREARKTAASTGAQAQASAKPQEAKLGSVKEDDLNPNVSPSRCTPSLVRQFFNFNFFY